MEKTIKTGTISIVKSERKITMIQIFARLISSTILFSITAFFIPNFSTTYIGALAISILFLTFFDFILSRIKRIKKTALSKAICGFICATLALYFLPHFMIHETVSYLSPLLGGLVYGSVVYVLPKEY